MSEEADKAYAHTTKGLYHNISKDYLLWLCAVEVGSRKIPELEIVALYLSRPRSPDQGVSFKRLML
jgi:hypothetical protein